MHEIERQLMGKHGSHEECEDALYFGPHFAAVVDGVTSKNPDNSARPSRGRIAALVVVDCINRLPSDVDAIQAVRIFSESVAATSQARNIDLAATCAILSRHRKEVWLIGDCQLLMGNRIYQTPIPADDLLARLRAFMLEKCLSEGTSIQDAMVHDEGRRAIEPFLRLQESFANNPTPSEFAYSVINGKAVPPHLVKVIPLSDREEEIVLATDGYPHLYPTLAASEAALSGILQRDPLCFREFKTTKGIQPGSISFDDRAYLRIKTTD